MDCENEPAAIAQALALLGERPQHQAVELWQDGRRIHPPCDAGGATADEETAALIRGAADTVVFLRLAAIELRRFADRFPTLAADYQHIADQFDAQAADLRRCMPEAARPLSGA